MVKRYVHHLHLEGISRSDTAAVVSDYIFSQDARGVSSALDLASFMWYASSAFAALRQQASFWKRAKPRLRETLLNPLIGKQSMPYLTSKSHNNTVRAG